MSTNTHNMDGPIVITASAVITSGLANLIKGNSLLAAALKDVVVDLPTLLTVAGLVFPAVWWLSRRLTQIDDKNAQLSTDLGKAAVEMEKVRCQLDNIANKVEDLPCQPPNTGHCEEE